MFNSGSDRLELLGYGMSQAPNRTTGLKHSLSLKLAVGYGLAGSNDDSAMRSDLPSHEDSERQLEGGSMP